ncbi:MULTISPECIES: four helix bundle protein [Serratia]|uniref:four helix bundle protein n=1 Tax=Serratia TaxID=613 RepID=UPI0021AD548A|nr:MULTISPECIES: four helix bundle protein [Serratia]MDX7274045.1 four helix bundle protein [Serratia marcescens]HAV6637275.1 four helix bundle protein [Serratia marcescens]
MKAIFKHPKVYDDLLRFYKAYWIVHKHLPRSFKITTGDVILQTITTCIKGVITANYLDKNNAEQRLLSGDSLGQVRTQLVIARGLLTVGWDMRFISHGSFMQLTSQLDGIEKQVTRWQAWFLQVSSVE